jgi:IPT/TIG domain
MATRKNSDGKPQISTVSPAAAIVGGEFQVKGKGFAKDERPRVTIGEVPAPVIIGSDSFMIVRVPEGVSAGELVVENGGEASPAWVCDVGIQIADSLHPVANPAVDSQGNIFATFSGSRGQKTPVSVYKIDLNYNVKPFLTDLMNATGLAFDSAGTLYVSSRHEGIVYQATPGGTMSVYVSRRAWPSTRKEICTWATAAARFSKSARRARSTSSLRSSRPLRLTISPSARTAPFM